MLSLMALGASICPPPAFKPPTSPLMPMQCNLTTDYWVRVDSSFTRECRRCTVVYAFTVQPYMITTHNPSIDHYISRPIHARTLFDEGVFTFIQGSFLAARNPDALAVDVGGNIGWFTMLMLAHGRRVVTFEPLPCNAVHIARGVARNGFGHRHTLYNSAVSDAAGRVRVHPTSPANPGNGAIGRLGIEVPAVTLDDVIDEDVTVLKVDVEGFELHVLAGATRLLCNRVVEFMLFEVAHLRRDGCSRARAHAFLVKLGYEAHAATDPPPYWLLDRNTHTQTNDIIYALKDPSRAPCKRVIAPDSCLCKH